MTSVNDGCTVTIGDYNVCLSPAPFACLADNPTNAQVDNLAPTSATLPNVAADVATHLLTPDIMFFQEIQDNSGPIDDGTVDASLTLSTLSSAIAARSSVKYNFTEVISVNDQDGGEPGGNIRPAYLYVHIRLLGSRILRFNPLSALTPRLLV